MIFNISSAYMSGSGSPATSSAPTIYQVSHILLLKLWPWTIEHYGYYFLKIDLPIHPLQLSSIPPPASLTDPPGTLDTDILKPPGRKGKRINLENYGNDKGLSIYYVIRDGGEGSSQFITILHKGGSTQFILIFHRGEPPQFITIAPPR